MPKYLNETEEVHKLRNGFLLTVRAGACPSMCKMKLWAQLKNAVVREAFAKVGQKTPPDALEWFGVPRARELTAVIRRLYCQWDAGKLKDQEFLDKAHAINADFEVLLEHGKVSDDEMMRYHDVYSAAIEAATETICL